ncbi:MAG: diadenylate cyclase CdaA [Oscillospiraceae bacterium]|nr:diadenylate cyclase CdaA [Oscillospiraceae bacterium]
MISTVGFFDILDIAIVALIFYGVLLRIRSSSAIRIASAIVLLLLVTWLTGAVKMRVLNYILTRILEIGVIALVIVFQPELRRALERVGNRSLLVLTNRRNGQNATSQVIARTVAACEIMARERTGVLIVFEREIALDDYFKSGTVIDAEVSAELLRNLFFTKASLHDGAVIIRQDRIAAAGCVLPLTENTAISSDLGTRHRAAIGMSEASDAVVVVVSEETGTISAAVGGMLKRSLTPQTLRKILETELGHIQDEMEEDSLVEKMRAWLFRRDSAQKKTGDGNEGSGHEEE